METVSPEEGRGREQQSLRCALLLSSAPLAGTQPDAGGRGGQEPAPTGHRAGPGAGPGFGAQDDKAKRCARHFLDAKGQMNE